MEHSQEELIGWLKQLCGISQNLAFPYSDCRRLLRRTSQRSQRYEGLIPDLDMFLSSVAGLCTNINQIRTWPEKKIIETEELLRLSFYEAYPDYKHLQLIISQRTTPALWQVLEVSDQTRMLLLQLLSTYLVR